MQVYAAATSDEPRGDRPNQKLVGFVRTPSIAPGESVSVRISIDPRAFMHWDEGTHNWATTAGAKELRVGKHSREVAQVLRL